MPRVLIVDDEVNSLRALAIGLRLEGFAVETAESALAAHVVLDREPCDLAIVDLMMPGTNGLDLAREMRARHPSLRVILTSAYHLSERQLARADCGVVGFVPKPYALAELAAFLRSKLTPTVPPPSLSPMPTTAPMGGSAESRLPLDTQSGPR